MLTRKRKSRIAPDSDGEELAATPPPSPETNDDNKRRSARNTHRKKYVDDVMLRFSDDEVPLQEAQVSKKVEGTASAKPTTVKKEVEGGEVGPNKPNFVYIVSIQVNSYFYAHLKFFIALMKLNIRYNQTQTIMNLTNKNVIRTEIKFSFMS